MRRSGWIVLSILLMDGCDTNEDASARPKPRAEADATVDDRDGPSSGGESVSSAGGESPSTGGDSAPSGGGDSPAEGGGGSPLGTEGGSPSEGGGGSLFGAGGEPMGGELGAGSPGPDPCSGVECEAGFECDGRTGECRDSDLCDDVDCGSESMCNPTSGACVTNLFENRILCEYRVSVCGSGRPEDIRNCIAGSTSLNVLDLNCILAARCDANAAANCFIGILIDDICPQVTCEPGYACQAGPEGQCVALPDCDETCNSVVDCGSRFGTLDECLVTCNGFWGARDRICLLAAECNADLLDFCWTP